MSLCEVPLGQAPYGKVDEMSPAPKPAPPGWNPPPNILLHSCYSTVLWLSLHDGDLDMINGIGTDGVGPDCCCLIYNDERGFVFA